MSGFACSNRSMACCILVVRSFDPHHENRIVTGPSLPVDAPLSPPQPAKPTMTTAAVRPAARRPPRPRKCGDLFMMLLCTRYLPASLLDAGRGAALHQVLLAKEEGEEERDERDEGHGEQRPPRTLARSVHEGAQRQLDGVHVGHGEEDQLAEEIVPGPDEREDRRRGEGGRRQWEHDPKEDPHMAAAVESRGLHEFPRDTPEELHH